MPKKINIGLNKPVFVIAEISANHNSSLSTAKKMIVEAAKSGVSAVKIQTYTPEEMTLNSSKGGFFIKEKNSLWKGQKLFDLYKKGTTPREWHAELFETAKKNNIILFSTPFSVSAVDFLEKFNPPLYKIASFENNDYELISRVIKTRKPKIISLGMAKENEIIDIVSFAKKKKAKKIILLKCTSSYPAPFEDLNLSTIEYLRKKFNCEIGFSDHSIGIIPAITSVAYGASVIEKHFKINEKGLDSKFSINQYDFKNLVSACQIAKKSRGKIFFGISKSEKNSTKYKRSLYLIKDIQKGEKITSDHINSIRGGKGDEPKNLFKYINRIAKKKLLSPLPLNLSLFR